MAPSQETLLGVLRLGAGSGWVRGFSESSRTVTARGSACALLGPGTPRLLAVGYPVVGPAWAFGWKWGWWWWGQRDQHLGGPGLLRSELQVVASVNLFLRGYRGQPLSASPSGPPVKPGPPSAPQLLELRIGWVVQRGFLLGLALRKGLRRPATGSASGRPDWPLPSAPPRGAALGPRQGGPRGWKGVTWLWSVLQGKRTIPGPRRTALAAPSERPEPVGLSRRVGWVLRVVRPSAVAPVGATARPTPAAWWGLALPARRLVVLPATRSALMWVLPVPP